MAISVIGGAASSGTTQYYQQTFTSSGTWTKPAGVKSVEVICVGGGAGGTGNTIYGGGGAGGYWRGTVDVSTATTVAVTVGAGATGTTSANVGGASSFGTYVVATGGNPPGSNTDASGGNQGDWYLPQVPGTGYVGAPVYSTPNARSWKSIEFGAGQFIAVSSSQYAIRSSDGVTWSEFTMPHSGGYSKVYYSPYAAKWFALAAAVNEIVYSTDGITWLTRAVPQKAETIAASAAHVVISNFDANSGRPYYTSDITAATPTWTQCPGGYWDGGGRSLTFNGSQWIALNMRSMHWEYQTTPDASQAWGFVNFPAGSQSNGYTYVGVKWDSSNQLWFAYGGVNSGTIYRNPGGQSTTNTGNTFNTGLAYVTDLAVSGSTIVVLNGNAQVSNLAVSLDGAATWSTYTALIPSYFAFVAADSSGNFSIIDGYAQAQARVGQVKRVFGAKGHVGSTGFQIGGGGGAGGPGIVGYINTNIWRGIGGPGIDGMAVGGGYSSFTPTNPGCGGQTRGASGVVIVRWYA